MNLSLQVRLALVVVLAGVLLVASSGTAFAAPNVNYLKYTNPIAYDLKSLQTTHFYASVDTSNTYAVLKVKTSRGDVIIYKGAIPAANTNFWFPAWKGMGPDGERLPSSAAYTAELTVSKGGQTGTGSARIAVSRIAFTIKGSFTGTESRVVRAYVHGGALNCYATATATPAEPLLIGSCRLGSFIYPMVPNVDNVARLDFPSFSNERPLNAVVYLRDGDAPLRTGSRDVRVFGSHASRSGTVTYSLTYLQ